MAVLIIGLVAFFAAHLAPATSMARNGVARLGPGGYRLAFSIVAGAGLVLVVWGYGLAREAGPPVLYDPPPWLRHVTLLLMLAVFPLLVEAYLPGRIAGAVRHPMITAVKVWAFAHLLTNGDAASVLLFGSFLAWGVVDRISLKRREAAGLVRLRSGPLRNDVVAIVVGTAIYLSVVFRLHLWLIGVPVV